MLGLDYYYINFNFGVDILDVLCFWIELNVYYICDYIDQWCQLYYLVDVNFMMMDLLYLQKIFDVDEKMINFFVMVDIDNELFGYYLCGNFGLCYVNVKIGMIFYSVDVIIKVVMFKGVSKLVNKFLFSLILCYDLVKDVLLCFNYGEMLCCLNFGDLNLVF